MLDILVDVGVVCFCLDVFVWLVKLVGEYIEEWLVKLCIVMLVVDDLCV